MPVEATTLTPTTPIEGSTSTEAAATSLLTSTETVATTEQQQAAAAAEAAEAAKVAEAAASAAAAAKAAGAPESYDFKAPEGKSYDAAVLEPFAVAAKEANLTQDAAQKLLDKMAPALAERQTAQVKAVQDGWLESSKTDKEFGGDKLPENLSVAKKAIEAFTTPELKTLLETTGLGNNPEVIRLFFRVGKAMSEDGFVGGRKNAEAAKDPIAILYDKTTK